MAKFCTKCGKPLNEGEICSCQMAKEVPPVQQNVQEVPPVQSQDNYEQKENQQQNQAQFEYQQYQQQATQAAKNFIGLYMEFIKKPVTVGKKMIAEPVMKFIIAVIVLQGVCSGLFATVAVNKYGAVIQNVLGSLNGASSMLGVPIDMTTIIKMPYFRIFVVTALASIVLSFVLAALILGVQMINKNNVSYMQMLGAVAIRSGVLIPAILVSLVLFELSASVGIVMFYAVSVWGFTTMIISLVSDMEEDKKNLFALMISIACLLFVFIEVLAIRQLWSYYLPDMIRGVISGVSSLLSDPAQLFRLVEEFI